MYVVDSLMFQWHHITLSAFKNVCMMSLHFLAVTTSGLVFHCSALLLAVLLVLLPSDVFVLLPALILFALVLMKVFAFVEFLKNIMTKIVSRVLLFLLLFWCFSVEIFLMNEASSINHSPYISIIDQSLSLSLSLIGLCFSSHRLSNNTSWFVHVISLECSQTSIENFL